MIRFGVATFAFNDKGHPEPLLLSNGEYFGTASMITESVEQFTYDGNIEDGYWGIQSVLDRYKFRSSARKIIVLMTNEERDKQNKNLTYDLTYKLLAENDIILYTVIEEQYDAVYGE